MNSAISDFRFAARSLRRNPGFAATAIAVLALGIGANTAIFSVVNAVLLKPLSYPDPDRMVQLVLRWPDESGRNLSVPEFLSFSSATDVLQDFAAYDILGPGVNLTGGDNPEQVKAVHVTTGYFKLFGAPLLKGRAFTAAEDRPGGERVAVLGNSLWRRRFGADPGIVGKSISVGNEPLLVVGILGPDFHPDPPADLLLPLQADPSSVSQAHYICVAARLKPGVTLEQANARLKLTVLEFRRRFPLLNPTLTFAAEPLRDNQTHDVRKALLILLGAVSFVLLIACANVANLLLARAAGRSRELAIRSALGASRVHIVTQLLAESLLLSVTGGCLGLIGGYFGVRGLLALYPGNIPRIEEQGSGVTLDWRVLVFTAAAAICTGIVFGLLPALGASRGNLSPAMREGRSRTGSGLKESRARSMLVVAEVALALVLLAGAALLIRSFAALRAVEPGVNSQNVLTLEMALTGQRFHTTVGLMTVVRDAQRRLEGLPGVVAAASTWTLPVENAFGSNIIIEGRPLPAGSHAHGGSGMRAVSPHFFDVFRVPLLRGRLFTDRDEAGAQDVVVISAAFARKYWPDGDPLGQLVSIDKNTGAEFAAPPRQVIGVVGDVHDVSLSTAPEPLAYLAQAQVPNGMTALDTRVIPLTWAVRTSVEPATLTEAIRKELRAASGGLAVGRIRTMKQVISNSTARSDFNTLLLVIFAAVALFLAAIGLYGLVSYSVLQRRQEIGVRMALGAAPSQVRNMILWQAARLMLLGVFTGLAAAFALARVMTSIVFGVKTTDPKVFGAVALLLALVVLAAAYVPSRRATRIDPIEALRTE